MDARYAADTGRRLDESWPAYPPLAAPAAEAWLERAEIRCVSAAQWRAPPGWRVPWRTVPTANWAVYHRGRAWLRLADGEIPIAAGDVVVLPAGAPHAVRQDPRARVLATSGHFHARVAGCVDLLPLVGLPVHLRRAADATARDLAARLARECAVRAPGWRAHADALTRCLVMHLLRAHGDRCAPRIAGAVAGDAARLLPALARLDERLADPDLALADLAEAAGLSPSRFRAVFRRATGCAPVRWVRRRRIEAACRLLLDGAMTVERIAHAAGFRDAAFFHRVFRAVQGTTPARYRSDGGG